MRPFNFVPALVLALLLSLSTFAAPHSVTLTWNAAPTATSYNVYRSETKGTGYVKIGTATTLSYVDTAVVVGHTYYYVVTSFRSSDTKESGNSSEVFGLIRPTAPTNLTPKVN